MKVVSEIVIKDTTEKCVALITRHQDDLEKRNANNLKSIHYHISSHSAFFKPSPITVNQQIPDPSGQTTVPALNISQPLLPSRGLPGIV